MEYIICNNDDYLACDLNMKYSIVHCAKDAYKWKSIDKAYNALHHIPKKYNQYHFKVESVTENDTIIDPIKNPYTLNYKIIDKVKEISIFIKEIEERKVYLEKIICITELEIIDIEHAAEFYDLNASQGYKLYRMLHEVRKKRRTYKDELQQIELILGTEITESNFNDLEKRITGMDYRTYVPRVNKKLFGV